MFVSKLREYAGKAILPKQSVKVSSNNITNVQLSPAQAINLFRICQEALNNAIKYALFTEFSIFLEAKSEHQLKLELTDDGIGFDLTDKLKNGYGLANMKQRAQDIEASFEIRSIAKEGTTIVLILPLNMRNYV